MGKLVKIKTQQTEINIDDFINNIDDEQKRKDSLILLGIMKKHTGENPVLWSNSIIGFGKKVYESPKTGRQVEWFKMGFAPRKNNFSLHIVGDINAYKTLLNKLGKHKTGVGCLYINKLAEINLQVLEDIIESSAEKKEPD